MLTALLAFTGCERSETDAKELSDIERLKKAWPGVRIERADPEQLKKLGPAVVPGILAPFQVDLFRKKALEGDGESAYKLIRHYDMVGNDAEAQAWTRIGAENGEYNSMMRMGFASELRTGLDGCVRAVYWFTRARAQLENEIKSASSDIDKADLEILIRAVDDETAHARLKYSGC